MRLQRLPGWCAGLARRKTDGRMTPFASCKRMGQSCLRSGFPRLPTADSTRPEASLGDVLMLARAYQLTAYDATYLELALRTGGVLATFDRDLAGAVRRAGGRVFGDPA